MEKENRLVIDVGTQSLRASVINRKGETLAFSQQKYPVAYNSPASGFAEQDADFRFLGFSTRKFRIKK